MYVQFISSHAQEPQIFQSSMLAYSFVASQLDSSFILAPGSSPNRLIVYKLKPDGTISHSFLNWKEQIGITSESSYAFFHALIDRTTALISVADFGDKGGLYVVGDGFADFVDTTSRNQTVSGDGRYVYYTRPNANNTTTLVRFNRQTKTKSEVYVSPIQVSHVQSSRLGERLLISCVDGRQIVVNGTSGKIVSEFIIDQSKEYSSRLILVPDGDIILGLGVYRNVSANQLRWVAHYYEAATGNIVDTAHIADVNSVSEPRDIFLSPDGSTMSVICDNKRIALHSLQSKATIIVNPTSIRADVVGVCADNRTIVLSEPFGIVSMCRAPEESATVTTTFLASTSTSARPRLSSGARYVLTAGRSAIRLTLDSLAQYDTETFNNVRLSYTYGNDVLTTSTSTSTVAVSSVDLTTLATTSVVTVPREYGTLESVSGDNRNVVFYHRETQQVRIIDCQNGNVLRSITVDGSGTSSGDYTESIQISSDGEFLLVAGSRNGRLFKVSTGESVGVNPTFATTVRSILYKMSPNARYLVDIDSDKGTRLIYDRENDVTYNFLSGVQASLNLATFTRDGENLIVVSDNGRVWRLRLPSMEILDEFQRSNFAAYLSVTLDYDAQSNTYAMSLDDATRLEIIRRGVVNSTADEVVTPQTTSFAVSTSDDELTFALADVVDVRMSTLTGQDVSVNARLTADAVMLPLHGTPRGTYVVRAATSTGKVYTVLLQKN